MPHLVAAPDKFRGTASAAEVAAAAAAAAREAGWTADEVPMSDGGEGLLDACGGARRVTTVTGPLGRARRGRVAPARDAMPHEGGADAPRTAVIEMSKAAGRALVPQPRGDDPVRATHGRRRPAAAGRPRRRGAAHRRRLWWLRHDRRR